MNVRVSALRPLGENLNMENVDSDHYIDFGAVGVYIAGLQVMTAMLVASLTCVLASWVLPTSFVRLPPSGCCRQRGVPSCAGRMPEASRYD